MSQGGTYGLNNIDFQMVISGELDATTVDTYLSTLFEWDQEDPSSTWKIIINCPGGEVDSGTALYEELKAYSTRGGGSHHIITVAAGQCMSMATLLMQAGDWRVTGRTTSWMFHQPRTGVGEYMQSMPDAEADLEHLKRWSKLVDEELLARTTLSPKAYYEQINGKMWLLTGHGALVYGFVDEER